MRFNKCISLLLVILIMMSSVPIYAENEGGEASLTISQVENTILEEKTEHSEKTKNQGVDELKEDYESVQDNNDKIDEIPEDDGQDLDSMKEDDQNDIFGNDNPDESLGVNEPDDQDTVDLENEVVNDEMDNQEQVLTEKEINDNKEELNSELESDDIDTASPVMGEVIEENVEVNADYSELSNDELYEVLNKLNSKDLRKVLKSLDKKKSDNYLIKKFGFTQSQVDGLQYVVNENGNLFRIEDFKLVPVLPTVDSKKNNKKDVLKVGKNNLLDAKAIKSIEKSLKSNSKSRGDSEPVLELVDERDSFTKSYVMYDNTIMLEIANTPVHYLEDGEYKDIDLEIHKTNYESFEYAIDENTFKTYFNEYDSLDDDVYVRYEKANEEGTYRAIEFLIPDSNPDGQINDVNKTKYTNVFPNVDFEYYIGVNKLKENIYVNEPLDSYDFKMLIGSSNLDFEVMKDKTIEITDEDTGEVLWLIDRPYAEDSGLNQLITYDLYYELSDVVHNGSLYKQLELKFDDKKFLEDAVFPITIDPTAFMNLNNFGYINNDADNRYWGYSQQYAIIGSPNGADDTYVAFLDFDMNKVSDYRNQFCTRADLFVYPVDDLGDNVRTTYTIKRLTEDFVNKPWNNRPSVSNSNKATDYGYSKDDKYFNVTNMMNDIFSSTFYGFEISGVPADETGFFIDYDSNARLNVYYDRKVELSINSINATNGEWFIGDTGKAFQPIITAQSGLTISTRMYIKPYGQNEYQSSEGVKYGMAPVFSVDYTTLPDGPFTLRFVSTAGSDSVSKSYTFYLDNNGPVINTFDVTPSTNQLSINANAIDMGYPSNTVSYKFELGEQAGTYQVNGNKVFTGLTPATEYPVKLTVKDPNNFETIQTKTISTLAKTPVMSAGNLTPTSLDLTFEEGNGTDAEYLVMMNDKYVNHDGTLTDLATWISVNNELLSVTGLTGNTEYTISAKARNKSLVESSLSLQVISKTSADLPDPIVNLMFNMVDNNLNITWDPVNNITGYEVMINDVVYNTLENTYTVIDTNLSSEYRVKVRGINLGGQGEWSVEESITPANAVNLSVKSDEEYLLTVNIENETDFTGKTYKVLYDTSSLELNDVCIFTVDEETAVGLIESEGINIISIIDGVVEFTVDKTIPSGYNYSGPINVMKFKGLKDTNTNVKLEIE